MSDNPIMVFCSCPGIDVADRIAASVVEQRLAACVTRSAAVASTYRWQGEVHTDEEILLIIKTMQAALPNLENAIRTLHPYELPEIAAVPICDGSPAYLQWIAGEVDTTETDSPHTDSQDAHAD